MRKACLKFVNNIVRMMEAGDRILGGGWEVDRALLQGLDQVFVELRKRYQISGELRFD
jgi:hypothetical protein